MTVNRGEPGYFVGVEVTRDRGGLVESYRSSQRGIASYSIKRALTLNDRVSDIISAVRGIVERPEYRSSNTTLLINTSILGRPIIQKLKSELPECQMVKIIASETKPGSEPLHIPILDIEAILRLLTEAKQIVVQEEHSCSDVKKAILEEALRSFRLKLGYLADTAPKIWAEGDAGHLVIATGLACWAAECL